MAESLELPSAQQVLGWLDTLSNANRWGDNDRRGTLNFIDSEVRRRAARLITEGEILSCSFPIDTTSTVNQPYGPPQWLPLAIDVEDVGLEYFGLVFHGYTVTHLDSLNHVGWQGRMYGGRSTHDAAEALDVLAAGSGVATRGVLLDVPAARGVPWLEPGEGVTPADLALVEQRQGVTVGKGDAVLLRTGYGALLDARGPVDVAVDGAAGWNASCLPWLHERQVAVIACDTAQDQTPSGYIDPAPKYPVHVVGIAAMGLWLIDNCALEELASACERLRRWEFHFTMAPLRIVGGTGSPVNVLAQF